MFINLKFKLHWAYDRNTVEIAKNSAFIAYLEKVCFIEIRLEKSKKGFDINTAIVLCDLK